ncbi:Histidine-containing phosphotransfer protein [Heracleum sosnowskyi]|uniref:Histidine-containing phosphotransfer protein n=1 Tax=Heracleum sosnowskyi TaxID=360622 RepID=A0AAD8LY10_9APIA|nr:Histidine-containing phosphotransfer protein [Heracleum sosnowskyi]
MDDVNQLQSQYLDFLTSLLREGLVDVQFMQLLELESVAGAEPQFLSDIVNEFFDASDKIVHQFDIAIEHQQVDAILKDTVYKFRGTNVSIGAKKVTTLCLGFEDDYNTHNYEGCLQCLPQIKDEYHVLKNKLQTVFSLQQQIVSAGGSIPVLG